MIEKRWFILFCMETYLYLNDLYNYSFNITWKATLFLNPRCHERSNLVSSKTESFWVPSIIKDYWGLRRGRSWAQENLYDFLFRKDSHLFCIQKTSAEQTHLSRLGGALFFWFGGVTYFLGFLICFHRWRMVTLPKVSFINNNMHWIL